MRTETDINLISSLLTFDSPGLLILKIKNEVAMTLKKLLLLTTLSLPISALAMDSHPMPPHHRADQLAKDLGLSEEQKTKLDEIFKQQHEKFRAVHEESHALIKQVLSPEQLSKWENMKSPHKQDHNQKMQNHQ
jgi:periplasmic protein CpxP/Spy